MSLILAILLLFQMWPAPGPGRAAYGGGGGGGDITWTQLTEGSDTTTEPSVTAAISPTANAMVYVAVGVAVAGGGQTGNPDSMSITGCSITWTQVGRSHYEAGTNRRSTYVFKGSSASPGSSCTLTIDFSSGAGATWTEHMWSVDQAANVNLTTSETNVTAASSPAATSLATTLGAAPAAGDHTYVACGVESTGVSAAGNSELETLLTNLGGGTDFRTVVAGYDSTPDATPAPGITWTGTNSGACVGFIVKKA